MIIPTLLPVRSNRAVSRRGGFDSIFDSLMNFSDVDSWRDLESKIGTFNPKINVIEEEDRTTVTAELPGIREEDIDITVKGEYLSIRGHKKEEKEEKEGKNYRYIERSYGEFERIVPLQTLVNADKIDASMKDGVLTLVLPKVVDESKKERKISVRKS